MRFAFFILLLAQVTFGASPFVDPSRIVDWTNNFPGVRGGIINRTTIFTNIVDAGADPTGVDSASAIIQSCIDLCPSNQVVYMPAGTFKLTGSGNAPALEMKTEITLRGAGINDTILVVDRTDRSHGIHFNPSPSVFTPDNNPPYSNNVYAIDAKGGTNLVLDHTGPYLSNYTVGRIMIIDMTNPPNLYIQGGISGDDYMGRLGGSRLFRQMVEILTVENGTNITFTPPLVWNYTNDPQVVYLPYVFRYSGLEDFQVTNTCADTLTGSLIEVNQTADCWMKNVGVHRGYIENISMQYALRNTITGCEMRHVAYYNSSGRGYPLLTRYASTQNYIYDNIIFHGRSGYITTSTGPYNVIAYNFAIGQSNAAAGIIHTFGVNHGGNPWFTLWEGNVGTGFTSDYFHGGSLHITLYRNWVKGWSPDATPTSTNYYQRTVNLWVSNMFYTVVGNVLGSANIGEGNSTYSSFTYEDSDPALGNVAIPVIYRLGMDGVGPSANYDSKTKDTLYRHANFVWSSTNTLYESDTETNLPSSLYLSAKPTWFSNLTWPAIGPDANDPLTYHLRSNLIPAQARFYGIDYSGGGGGGGEIPPYRTSANIEGNVRVRGRVTIGP